MAGLFTFAWHSVQPARLLRHIHDYCSKLFEPFELFETKVMFVSIQNWNIATRIQYFWEIQLFAQEYRTVLFHIITCLALVVLISEFHKFSSSSSFSFLFLFYCSNVCMHKWLVFIVSPHERSTVNGSAVAALAAKCPT